MAAFKGVQLTMCHPGEVGRLWTRKLNFSSPREVNCCSTPGPFASDHKLKSWSCESALIENSSFWNEADRHDLSVGGLYNTICEINVSSEDLTQMHRPTPFNISRYF